MKTKHTMIALSVLLLAVPTARARAADDGRDTAHYTADAPVDFLHMRLELNFTPDGLRKQTCDGRVEYTLRPHAEKIDSVRLDAVNMQILTVEMPGDKEAPAFSYDDRMLTVRLPRPIDPGQTIKLAVRYRLAKPTKGMHFILPTAAEPNKPIMVYTMSEPIEARCWVPAHDWPNMRWTSDIIVTAPAPYTVVANGVLQERKQAGDGKSVTFHWHNDRPTDPHLMGLALGELIELRDIWRGKLVRVYTPPAYEAAARYTCRRVPEMLEFYTQLVGVDFPYPGYSHVVVVDHHHGGMEHAGFSFVAPRFLATSDNGDVPLEPTESVYLSHMLAHQWFGGLVNYRSVSQAWLNEGFAILLDSSWTTHTDAPERFACKFWEQAQRIAAADTSENGKAMVNRDLKDPNDIYHFDGLKVYYKGAWVLQMLRHQLGDELFWKGVRKYLQDHQWQAVETSDLRRALEEVSGHDLEQFFQQWVFGHGVPHLDVSYAWDVDHKRATISVRQTQKIDAATPAFAFPLDLYFKIGGEDKLVTVDVRESRREWTFDFPAEPTVFCVDPRGGLLKTLVTHVPRAMLERQAVSGPTALARQMAVEDLGKQADPNAIAVLERILLNESEFWMVRQSACRGLRSFQNDDALHALLRAGKQPVQQPRVLAAVIGSLAGYPSSSEAHAAVLRHATAQDNIYVEMAAVSALGRMHGTPSLAEQSQKALQAAAAPDSRRAVREAAQLALRRPGSSPVGESGLRERLAAVEKQNHELQRQLQELSKKLMHLQAFINTATPLNGKKAAAAAGTGNK
jgi:aminopeptidase N